MKFKKTTISIGIPAYNEEANIGYLLRDLLAQKTGKIKLKEIIVNSDGSTDRTAAEVRKVKSKKIILMDNKKRKGRSLRQNQIMEKTGSGILVLIDADTLIIDKYFLEKISAPIISGKANLTSLKVEELPAENFFERILETSMKLKKYIFENINHGDNLYTCHGRARAFSRKLYKSIKFTDSVAEDAYSYLYCISKGMKYKFVTNTQIYYKLPGSFSDHQKQSIRFIKSQEILSKKFGADLVKENFRLPLVTVLLGLIRFFIKRPLYVLAYILVFGFLKMVALFNNAKNTWDISPSSKILRKELI